MHSGWCSNVEKKIYARSGRWGTGHIDERGCVSAARTHRWSVLHAAPPRPPGAALLQSAACRLRCPILRARARSTTLFSRVVVGHRQTNMGALCGRSLTLPVCLWHVCCSSKVNGRDILGANCTVSLASSMPTLNDGLGRENVSDQPDAEGETCPNHAAQIYAVTLRLAAPSTRAGELARCQGLGAVC